MEIFPTEEEIDTTANLLVNRYNISTNLLGKLFDADRLNQTNSILRSLGGAKLTAIDIARLVIQIQGPQLLAGSRGVTRTLRLHLLNKIPDTTIKELFARHEPKESSTLSASRMRKRLAERNWHSGKHWPKDFVSTIDLPAIFTGITRDRKAPAVQDVQPLKIPPKLVEFQENLKEQMQSVLANKGNQTRCVVTLPTGGGKTRVAVEAFIDWMQPRFSTGAYLIWIAQSEELCEQAIACIEQMWSSREFVAPLRIYRFFGGREIPLEELRGGAVVASIQQLYYRITGNDESLKRIIKNIGAMIIDEAHRATSPMYDTLLNEAINICGNSLFPICGLTATPGRTGINSSQETLKLVGRFEAYLIKPNLGAEYDNNPLKYFRDCGFLAQAHHVLFYSGEEYTLTDNELDDMEKENDIPIGFLNRLANDNRRNLRITKRLLSLPKNTPTLVYACSVEHAYFLSAILTAQGRKSAAISASTPTALRRILISNFREQKIEFLCNYGVLTTGFDAPKIECIALCRPTTSEVLYEQIVGRGLRGIKFGGTQKCTIIDFADNIIRLGPPLAYARFADFWNDEKIEL